MREVMYVRTDNPIASLQIPDALRGLDRLQDICARILKRNPLKKRPPKLAKTA